MSHSYKCKIGDKIQKVFGLTSGQTNHIIKYRIPIQHMKIKWKSDAYICI